MFVALVILTAFSLGSVSGRWTEEAGINDLETVLLSLKRTPPNDPCSVETNGCAGSIINVNTQNKNWLLNQNHFIGFDVLLMNKQPYQNYLRRRRRAATNLFEWQKSADGVIYVPYVIDGLDNAKRLTENLERAAVEYATHTCYRLVKRTNQKDYVNIGDFSGCWSQLGKRGGEQTMSLSKGCQSLDTVLHEFMHVLGFLHEHSRQDRDTHISVNYQNIDDKYRNQFLKFSPTFVHGVAYDFVSIMHYGRKSASNDPNKDSMTAIQNPKQNLGSPSGSSFSPGDIRQLNLKGMCGKEVEVYGGTYAT